MLTDAQRVADYLSVELTGLQHIQVDRLLPAADSWIFRHTGRVFGLSAALTGERHTPMGGWVFLHNRPVASVQAVRVRSWGIGAASTALVAATSYELVDPAAGILAVGSSTIGGLLEVDYTPGQTTPDDVKLAATILIASWLQPTIAAESAASGASTQAIKSYAIGSELTVAYDTSSTTTGTGTSTDGVPDDVLTLLAPYRQIMVFS